MRHSRSLLLWPLLGLAGVLLLVWAYPRAFPLAPRDWKIDREQALRLATERLRDLGTLPADPYVVVRLRTNPVLERQLQLALGHTSRRILEEEGLVQRLAVWDVTFFPDGAAVPDWAFQARIGLSGELIALRRRLDPQAAGATLSTAEARQRADAFLMQQGIDLAAFGEPEIRSQQLARRTDITVRYPDRRPAPVRDGKFGVDVSFAGDQLMGFLPFFDDPAERPLQQAIQESSFSGVAGIVILFVAFALLAPPFLRRYHEGEIGVRRAAQIFVLIILACGAVLLATARPNSQTVDLGFATREQTTWVFALFLTLFSGLPNALIGFFAWSVGEVTCRERWGRKLAAFDALFQRDWANATVARSALTGVGAGLFLAGLLTAALLPLQRFDAWPLATNLLASAAGSGRPFLQLVGGFLGLLLPSVLVTALCLVPLCVRWAGKTAGILLALPGAALLLYPAFATVPLRWGMLVALLLALAVALLVLTTDLLAVLIASFLAITLISAYPLLLAHAPGLQSQGWLALAVGALPLLLSLRSLASRREFVYRYEDVPPHVRRIAERERQRVELETARGIQSSILPDLPPRLAGVDLAHTYRPASEVGGDFYDVLALEDGRLAVAVGDVAGHGVSSGLVMSMAKSALAVQVTFDPTVEAVFHTLNRTVYQSARKRLLTTLCYALLDPIERELLYASAGHLFPYVVSRNGTVMALESVAYPLGVRGTLPIVPSRVQMAPGDTLFLFSDGLVEARAEGSEEEFGFRRLEESLVKHYRKSVEGFRDGILADVERFTRHAPREDDQTLLVLRLPNA